MNIWRLYMRKKERIDIFLNQLGKIWKENCPDWRFGQFMVNVLNTFDIDPFFLEEDDMIKKIEQYFNKEENNDISKKD